MMKICPNCKSENVSEAKFCIECGANFRVETVHIGTDTKATIFSQTIKQKDEKIIKSIQFATAIPLGWGCFNTTLWFFLGSGDRSLFINSFSEIKLLLWIVLYGGLVISLVLLFFGLIGFFIRCPTIVLLEALCLFLIGIWNIGSDFLAIPALKKYGYFINANIILKDINILWIIFGVLQLMGGFYVLRTYTKISSENV